MGLTRINNNVSAVNANRNLTTTGNALQVSLERLSSGLRINRAADDAAGLSISENLRAQINGLNRAIDNSSEAINLVNTAEGALIESTARLQRIRVLAVQAANTGTNDANALQAIQDEIETSIAEITRIGNNTQFGSRLLLNGSNANSVSIADSTSGLSLANGPTSSTLSTGTRYLSISRTTAASITLGAGSDGNDNTGANAPTGLEDWASTFDTGTYNLSLSNVRAAVKREVGLGFTIDQGGSQPAAADNLMASGNEASFIDADGNTFTIGTGDVVRFIGTESDGTAFDITVTIAAAGLSITGLVGNINTGLTEDSASWDAANGQFVIAATTTTGESPLTVRMQIDQGGGGAPVEFNAANVVRVAGNDNDGVLSIDGGPAVQVSGGDTNVTLYGQDPSDLGQPTPQITLDLATTITEGTDTLTIVQAAYTGVLEGGQSVTFQNGDQNVQFRSGTSAGFASGETITLDFDANLDLGLTTKTTLGSKTFVLSAVSNALSFQIGANSGQRVNVAFGDLRASNLGFVGETQANGNDKTVAGINITTLTGAEEAMEIVDEAINQINAQRSALGAFTNRLTATISNLGVASENLTASESRIRDADFAFETTRFTRNQILLQAGVNILSQANLQPQNVLALLG